MKKFITEMVQVVLPARQPDSRSDQGGNGGAAAFRCALLAPLVLGLLGGIGQAQEPLKIDSKGDVRIASKLTVDGSANFSGNVGIGTNDPQAPLQIGNDSSFQRDARIRLSTSLGAGKAARAWSVGVKYGGNDTSSPNYGFTIRDEGANADRMVIDFNTGNVGIGTNDPQAPLQIGNDSSFQRDARIRLSTSLGAGKAARAWSVGVKYGGNDTSSPNYGFTIRDEGANADRMVIDFNTGYVGIGTNTPKAQLEVAQDALIDGKLFVNSSLVFHDGEKWYRVGSLNTGEECNANNAKCQVIPSDTRLKTDLHPIPSALEKVSQLRGVTFRWNEQGLQYLTRDIETTLSAGPVASDEDNRKLWQAERDKRYKDLSTTNVGVLAQDVEAVLPQAVTTDASGYKLVNYTELIPLVIEALKEEDKISQEQARTITSQQTEIQRLTVANNSAQQQLSELQEVKQKLEYLETTVNKLLAAGLPGDKDKLASAVERPAGDHASGSE